MKNEALNLDQVITDILATQDVVDGIVSRAAFKQAVMGTKVRGLWEKIKQAKKIKQIDNKKWDVSKYVMDSTKQESVVEEEPVMEAVVTKIAPKAEVEQQSARSQTIGFEPRIPEKDPSFVPFGIFKDIRTIIESGEFSSFAIVGETGNGKTKAVLQAAAVAKRKLIPVSIEFSTGEDELIGKYTMRDGTMIYEEGPVLVAMKTGSILLLDELDRGNPENLICLHMVLDGYPYLDKKSGEYVYPQPGFSVIATMNTKGQGDATDRYVAAKVMDEAFLERFHGVLEQNYPSPSQEVKLLSKICDNEKFVDSLVKWANVTRNTYRQGGIANFITTRRLAMIADKNYRIFKSEEKAVEVGINRFDSELRESLVELFNAIHGGSYTESTVNTSESAE